MDSLDRRIINQLQGGFPVCERPFREAAQRLGTTESELITRLRCMLDDGLLTRFGPLFHAEQLGGDQGALRRCLPASTLGGREPVDPIGEEGLDADGAGH